MVVGDAPAEFILQNGAKADVVVYGETYTQQPQAGGSTAACTSIPLDLAELSDGLQVTYQAVEMQFPSCSSLDQLSKVVLHSATTNTNFIGCEFGLAYFDGNKHYRPGVCYPTSTTTFSVFYCSTSVASQSQS